MKTILFDASLCNGCYGCQFACKDEHCGNDWSPIAAEQPLTGSFWCKMTQEERGAVPEVKVSYLPIMCGHCDECELVKQAPDVAYRREDGLVIIDPTKAKGRRDLVDMCPVHAVYWNEALELPQKCTGCAHLLDNGWEVPRCVDVCATGALKVVDDADVPAEAETLDGVATLGSHYKVMNYSKRWIYGCFVDREHNEVLIGAKATLVDGDGNIVSEIETDDFGEFRFKELEDGDYSVRLAADGFEPVELPAGIHDKDVVLGDIFAKAAA